MQWNRLWYPCHLLKRTFPEDDGVKRDAEVGLNWAGLPLIATVVRLLCRDLTLQNEYLRIENEILKSKMKGRIRFTDKEVRTFCGLRTAYVLFVLHLNTRRVILAEATYCPHGRWMSQMARNALMECDDLGITSRFVLHDRDVLFIHDFDGTLKSAGVDVVKTPFRAPNANAHAERWVLSVESECLDHVVLFGLECLRRTISVYRDFHNEHRPHQGIRHRIPGKVTHGAATPNWRRATPPQPSQVDCAPFLGGLLKSYSRRVA